MMKLPVPGANHFCGPKFPAQAQTGTESQNVRRLHWQFRLARRHIMKGTMDMVEFEGF